MRSPASLFPLCQILLLVLLCYSASSSSTCYYPDGSKSNDTLCQDTFYSACCSEKDVCLSNGLCYSTTFLRVGRSSCTDITWGAPECPKLCLEELPNDGNFFAPCGVPADTIFACQNTKCLESNFTITDPGYAVLRGEQTKIIAPPSASTSTSVGAATNTSATFTTPGFIPAPSCTCLTLGSAPTPSCTCPTLGSAPTPSCTCPTLGSAPTLTPSDCPLRLPQGSKVVGVGAGLGVSLGITILAVVALFTVEKRRNQRLLQEMRRMTSEDGSHAGQIWINRQGPEVEAPQDLAQHEMPPRPLVHELSARSP